MIKSLNSTIEEINKDVQFTNKGDKAQPIQQRENPFQAQTTKNVEF